MNLRLIREPSRNGATLGVLFVDQRFFSFCLEDEIREVPGQPVSAWKVTDETAIPAGRYRIVITQSARFKRPLPLLLGVNGFEGIRIHPGNRKADTSGCLLPGRLRGEEGTVGQSKAAFDALFARLQSAAGQDIWISIENPQPDVVAA